MRSGVIAVPIKPFSLVGVTELDAVEGRPTNECFTGLPWEFRSKDFDKWLPPDQPDSEARVITTLTFSGNWKFLERAIAILGLEESLKPSLVGMLLIEHNYVLAATQIQAMAEDARRRRKDASRSKNLFFIRTRSVENPVAVVFIDEDDWSQLYANIYQLNDGVPWYGHIPLHVPLQKGSRFL
ncbi:MAG: hypothetical protein G01um101449_190 [Parcubacteria group bacterium Gr01-1014_49]|nr:MAG: hypothetical protein G01um101449_190 [Parcubacteria group bacterium Gr01-1014_49]